MERCGGRSKTGMGYDANKCNGDKSRQSEWLCSIRQALNPRAIEFVIGILSAVGINQNVDIGHLHWNLPPLISELGQLLGCLVKMKWLTVDGHCKGTAISLGRF
jgi:hypothetical protein